MIQEKIKNSPITIKNDLLNKYQNINTIFQDEKIDKIVNIDYFKLNIKNRKANYIYHLATEIFKNNHQNNYFENQDNTIYVTNSDIKESINKLYNDRLQNPFLEEHLMIFSKLGEIIESARLVNQTFENKNRHKYIIWNYYFNGIKIQNQIFSFEFDVVSRSDGQNHYRIQRIQKAEFSQLCQN